MIARSAACYACVVGYALAILIALGTRSTSCGEKIINYKMTDCEIFWAHWRPKEVISQLHIKIQLLLQTFVFIFPSYICMYASY